MSASTIWAIRMTGGEGAGAPGSASRRVAAPKKPGTHAQSILPYWKIVVPVLIMGLLLGWLAASAATPQYRSTAQAFISFRTTDLSAQSKLQGLNFIQQQMGSYADLVTSPLVLGPVIEKVGLDETPEELADRVEATSSEETVLIDITVTDPRPETASTIADEIAISLGDGVLELERPEGTAQDAVQVTTVRPAPVPEDASAPNSAFLVAIGGALGLSAGVALSVLVAYFGLLQTRSRTREAAR